MTRDGDRTIIWLEGDHDIATVVVLADALAQATADDNADLIVDMSGTTFLGAATVGALVHGREILRQGTRNLTLRDPSKAARRVIDLCGLANLVDPAEPGQVELSLPTVDVAT